MEVNMADSASSSLSSDISILSLQEELECPICLRPFNAPKLVGECLHTFCLSCIRQHIEKLSTGDTFPCPLCRESCRLPAEGADGLKSDFRMANIVEKCKSAGSPARMARSQIEAPAPQSKSDVMTASVPVNLEPPKIANAPPCGVCSKPAANFCEGCRGVNLCEEHSLAHSATPFTKEHKLIELCSLHGKPIECYCLDCDGAACCLCLLSVHPTDSHRVKSFQDVFKSAQTSVDAALNEATVLRGMVQSTEKGMAAFYCQVSRKREQERLDREEAADETSRKFEWELRDVRAEIINVRKRLEVLGQQEQDLSRAKELFERENTKRTEEDKRSWKAVLGDLKTSISSLGDYNRGLKSFIDDSQAVKKVGGLSAENLTRLRVAKNGLRNRIADAEQSTTKADKMRMSLKGKLGIYQFHHMYPNPPVAMKQGSIAERWNWDIGWAMVFTDQPLEDGKMVEVMVTGYDDKRPDWGSAYGVSMVPPGQLLQIDSAGKCYHEGTWEFNGSWTICGNTIRRGNRHIGLYKYSTKSIRKTTRLGIVWHSDKSVNFFIDGQDYGTAFNDVPEGSYGYFCLDGRVTELTIL